MPLYSTTQQKVFNRRSGQTAKRFLCSHYTSYKRFWNFLADFHLKLYEEISRYTDAYGGIKRGKGKKKVRRGIKLNRLRVNLEINIIPDKMSKG